MVLQLLLSPTPRLQKQEQSNLLSIPFLIWNMGFLKRLKLRNCVKSTADAESEKRKATSRVKKQQDKKFSKDDNQRILDNLPRKKPSGASTWTVREQQQPEPTPPTRSSDGRDQDKGVSKSIANGFVELGDACNRTIEFIHTEFNESVEQATIDFNEWTGGNGNTKGNFSQLPKTRGTGSGDGISQPMCSQTRCLMLQ